MWFSEADASALGRCLAQVADDRTEVADLFLEDGQVLELRCEEPGPGVVERLDRGLAFRLVRDGRTYLAARDGFETDSLRSALREVARVAPVNAYRVPDLAPPSAGERPPRSDLEGFPDRLRGAVRELHAAFEFRLRVAAHQRRVQLVGRRLVPEVQSERFYSVSCVTAWGRFGALLPSLDEGRAKTVAGMLVNRFHARGADTLTEPGGSSVLGPAAVAVLLHEAVAHALEADTLVASGRPESAIGVRLGSALLNVLDSPGDLPVGLARETDDEGMPVSRRWLLRDGEVKQPLADRFHAGSSAYLLPGAGRRSSRHLPPVPRSTHLELLAGDHSFAELLAGEAGLYLPEISGGSLDPLTGRLEVRFPYGRRFEGGELGDWVGGSVLRGSAAEILSSVEAVGRDCDFAGAGWCAKAGHRLPVWATCPPVRLRGRAGR